MRVHTSTGTRCCMVESFLFHLVNLIWILVPLIGFIERLVENDYVVDDGRFGDKSRLELNLKENFGLPDYGVNVLLCIRLIRFYWKSEVLKAQPGKYLTYILMFLLFLYLSTNAIAMTEGRYLLNLCIECVCNFVQMAPNVGLEGNLLWYMYAYSCFRLCVCIVRWTTRK